MADRRSELLTAAKKLFHQYGPRKTTIGDIARAAGVGVGTVYLEFANKDAILLALSEADHRAVLDATRAAWNGRGAPEARLRRAFEARLGAFLELAETGMHGSDLLHCGGCTPIQQAHQAFCAAEHELFARFVGEGVQEGAFALTHSASRTAHALLLAYSAFGPPAVFSASPEKLQRDLHGVHALVFPGLLAR